jgi:hypothetical protein
MPPLPVITGIHRVALNWRVGAAGPTAANVMHFSGASVDPTGLYNALGTHLTANMWIGIGTDTSIWQVAITPLDGTTATAIFAPTGPQWAGASAPGDYIPSSAGIVSLRTLNRGRQYRGRLYTPFPLELLVQDGRWVGSLTSIQTAWDSFRTGMTTALWPWQVASYGHSLHRTKTPGGGYTLTPVTWTPHATAVSASTFEVALATQRRRQSRLR